MRDVEARLTRVLVAIDEANNADPTVLDGKPLALVQGQLASTWLADITESPSEHLQVAVRAHHLRRWEIKRQDYDEGRAGYLRWRRDNKKHQADCVVEILDAEGYGPQFIELVQRLLLRKGLGSDPETQTLEDVACLVFVATQFEEMAARIETDRMVNVVAKTLKKMSPAAIERAAQQPLTVGCQEILGQAVEVLAAES